MGTTYIDPARPVHPGLAVHAHSNRFGRLFGWGEMQSTGGGRGLSLAPSAKTGLRTSA